MAKRVNLDAMIPREDFGIEADAYVLDLFRDFPISYLSVESPIQQLLRKPDFQRETNHWNPTQLVTFLASFVDSEVIPSLILWKAPRFIFVIDGGHRLSALRAWMVDDYGDGALSLALYKGQISDEQREIAKYTRKLVERSVGRYTTLRSQVSIKDDASDVINRRAQVLFTRALALQWIQGTDAAVAETSFFKINSQGTPLDEIEITLIRNRKKPIAIAARAILRAGSGHKYWSGFGSDRRQEMEEAAEKFHDLLFEPEAESPVKSLELPLGGSVSPVNALALLIEFLAIAGCREKGGKVIEKYDDDDTGEQTIHVLKNALEILNRFTTNNPPSLGLHPAVYFYNERGKYSRFLFLGMTMLIQEKIRNNDDSFFKKFTRARKRVEQFLIDNKSLIGIVLQNLAKGQRVPKMKDLFEFLVTELQVQPEVAPEAAMAKMGLRGRVLDVVAIQAAPAFTDDTKSMLFIKQAIATALRCPLCGGLLDPKKSVSYDHIKPVREGGTGNIENAQLAHPYCNTGYKEMKAAETNPAAPSP
jgi:hypothetical protein